MNYPELESCINQFRDEQIQAMLHGGGAVPRSLEKHSHYKKDVSHLQMVDVYRVIDLWEIKHPALQHALKKVMAAGKRGAKDEAKDVQEAIDSLERWKQMQTEDGKA